jgi:hypothetical protein
MNELVRRLSEGSHPVELTLRPEKGPKALEECLKRGYVHVKFTNTNGGTELGVKIDEDTAQLALAAVNGGTVTFHVAGNLWLDYVHVRCVADIDVGTYQGLGHLELLQ